MEATIKKVCILQNGLARGGTDTFVVNLCRAIDKKRFKITVVNPSVKPESQVREPEVLATGARIVHSSPLTSITSKIRHLKILYRILKDENYDVFQTNIDLFNGPNLFVAWLAGVPVRCCHSHNGMQQKSIIQGITLSIRIYQSVMKWMCWTFANRHCGCSDVANEFLYTGKPWRHVNYPTIINNGIDIDFYREGIHIEKKRKKLGFTKKYHILTVGRIIPQKNPIFIAETISELCKKRSDVDFVWISDGPLKNACIRFFEAAGVLDRIHFLGFRTDVADIMKCCNLFYMPSVFEGLPLVLVESQAAGLPCLVSENITKQANCGAVQYLSLERPIEDWAKAMSDILDGKTILKTDENKIQAFSIRHMAEQMMQVFQK